MKFTKETLKNLLNDIVDEQFAEEPHNSFQEMIDYVVDKYKEEIDTLELIK